MGSGYCQVSSALGPFAKIITLAEAAPVRRGKRCCIPVRKVRPDREDQLRPRPSIRPSVLIIFVIEVIVHLYGVVLYTLLRCGRYSPGRRTPDPSVMDCVRQGLHEPGGGLRLHLLLYREESRAGLHSAAT